MRHKVLLMISSKNFAVPLNTLLLHAFRYDTPLDRLWSQNLIVLKADSFCFDFFISQLVHNHMPLQKSEITNSCLLNGVNIVNTATQQSIFGWGDSLDYFLWGRHARKFFENCCSSSPVRALKICNFHRIFIHNLLILGPNF